MNRCRITLAAIVAAATWLPSIAQADITLDRICRVKGQEENTLQGLGFVVGLEGTGDGGQFMPTVRSLAKAMEIMGEPLGSNGLAELKDAKNVALVSVTATVPAGGARRGDKLDCSISSVGSAKSLEGGRLFLTPLVGPDKNNPQIFAFAEGKITLDDPELTRTGSIHSGCRLEADFFTPYVKDGRITLVLDKSYASFQVAQDVADLINARLGFQGSESQLAVAIDQVNIVVSIPQQYQDAPAMFVAQITSMPIMEPETGARVVINERAGTIVITGDVEIGAVAVTHKNVVVQTGTEATGGRYFPLDPGQTDTPRLKSLVEALDAVNVSNEDMIEIIKRLDRSGKLYGRLIIE